jgi:uncharacterized protein DUF5947
VSTASTLRRLATARPVAGEAAAAAGAAEACELCGATLDARHRHVVNLETRTLMCACRACVILLARPGAGGRRFRLVPERRLRLDGFRLDDSAWEALRIPVDLAFFFRSTAAGRVVAAYPGALGVTESLLELDAWEEIEADNPVLAGLEPDVEALLVNRSRRRRQAFVVPIDDCYALAGIVRTRWRGLAGGGEVWKELDAFFGDLERRT